MNTFKEAPCGQVFGDIIYHVCESHRELKDFVEQAVALVVQEGVRAPRLG